jgi:hypothetical protein
MNPESESWSLVTLIFDPKLDCACFSFVRTGDCEVIVLSKSIDVAGGCEIFSVPKFFVGGRDARIDLRCMS